MKSGRKKIELDVKEIERLAGLGFTQGEICTRLGFSDETLRRHKLADVDLVEALKRGKAAANDKVSSKLMTLVDRGNLGAIIWYEKTRRGLSDRVQVEVKDWRDKLIEAIRDHKLSYEPIATELGTDLATELFERAGIAVSESREATSASELAKLEADPAHPSRPPD